MKSRSRSDRHIARVLMVSGVVALSLSVDPVGPLASGDQGTAPSAKEAATSPGARLRMQKLRTRKARAVYEIARLRRELAEIAVEEYPEVIYRRDLKTVEGEIKLAESDLARAEDHLAWARRMQARGFLFDFHVPSAEMAFEKAKFTLENAQSQRKVLIEYTGPKTIQALRSDVEKARKDEEASRSAWEREVIRQVELERRPDRA